MNTEWDEPVILPATSHAVRSSEEAFTYLSQRWKHLPPRERSRLFRRLLAERRGLGAPRSARQAFVDLVNAERHHRQE